MALNADIIDVADAVVAAMNSSPFSQKFTAERWYVPIHNLPALTTLQVTVVPATDFGELLNRAGKYMDTHTISIGVQQVIGQGNMTNAQIKAACDPLMFLCQEIRDLFAAKPLVGDEDPITGSQPVCIGNEWNPIFAPDHMDEKRVFTSVVTLKFKVAW